MEVITPQLKGTKKTVVMAVIVVIALIAIAVLNPFVMIAAGHRGVVMNFGAVQDKILNEGVHFRIPIMQRIEEISIQIRKATTKSESASRDLQQIHTVIALNYRIDPSMVNKLYQDIGLDFKVIVIDPAIEEVVKSVTAKFSAEELITKRPLVAAAMESEIKERLIKHHINVKGMMIEDFDFSEGFNNAIEQKQKAEQDALTEKNKLEKVKFEAEQVVTRAKAEALSLKAKRLQITNNLLKLKQLEIQEKAVEKWKGDVPQYMMGQNVPFLGKMLGSK